jgi:hypothetical protein
MGPINLNQFDPVDKLTKWPINEFESMKPPEEDTVNFGKILS